MKQIKIIMDTNVLYSGLYSSKGASFRILRALSENRIMLVISTALLFEYEDVLKRNKRKLGLSNHDIDVILDNICGFSEHPQIHFLWRPFLSDPKDDHILELAVASGVQTIVTYNIRHFRNIEQFGIRAIKPQKLLEEMK